MEKLYAPTHLPFWQCLKQIFVTYPKIYKPVFVLLVIFAALHLLDVPLHHTYWPIAMVGFIALFLFGVYMYASILWIAHSVLNGEAVPTRNEAFRHTNRLIFNILGGIVLILAIHGLLWGLSYTVSYFAFQYYVGILSLVILFMISMLAAVLFYFTLPLIILDRIGPLAALKRSVQLTYGRWWYCFGTIFLVFGAVAFVASLGVVLYRYDNHFVNAGYDFVVLMIVHPLYVTLTLNLLNEIKKEKVPIQEEVESSPA